MYVSTKLILIINAKQSEKMTRNKFSPNGVQTFSCGLKTDIQEPC